MSFNQHIEYSDPSDYLYDSSKIEFVAGGGVRLKDQRPVGALFFANYSSTINGTWANGSLTATGVGSPAVSGGRLDLNGPGLKNVRYAGYQNALLDSIGTIRFKLRPNYNGSPAANRYFVTLRASSSSDASLLSIYQDSAGVIKVDYSSSLGETPTTLSYGAWVPVSGTEYEHEFNFNFSSGSQRYFIGGALQGSETTATVTRRSVDILDFLVGTNRAGTAESDFQVDDLIVFNAVQHSASYTPSTTAITATIYPIDTPSVVNNIPIYADSFSAFTRVLTDTLGTDTARYQIDVAGTLYYYNSGWVVSDGTYAQSSTQPIINTNIASLTFAANSPIKFRAMLFSTAGATTPTLHAINLVLANVLTENSQHPVCRIYAYLSDLTGGDLSPDVATYSPKLVVKLDRPIRCHEHVILPFQQSVAFDTNGYAELDVISTDSIGEYLRFFITYKNTSNGVTEQIFFRPAVIPTQENASLQSITSVDPNVILT